MKYGLIEIEAKISLNGFRNYSYEIKEHPVLELIIEGCGDLKIGNNYPRMRGRNSLLFSDEENPEESVKQGLEYIKKLYSILFREGFCIMKDVMKGNYQNSINYSEGSNAYRPSHKIIKLGDGLENISDFEKIKKLD